MTPHDLRANPVLACGLTHPTPAVVLINVLYFHRVKLYKNLFEVSVSILNKVLAIYLEV